MSLSRRVINGHFLEAIPLQWKRALSQPVRSQDRIVDAHHIRNVGIIAHINAGKTTTSERIIYYSGLSDTIGDVDRGNTITDYMKQERERGITITSAAITYFWRKHKINLIDTPGHVDFTYEVERSLSVLDGAVTILDSSEGVEAQTMTVWWQANRYNLPNIIYLNKYDKPTSNVKLCLDDIRSKLQVEPLSLQLPIKSKDNLFHSVIDLINRRRLIWPTHASDHEGKYETIDVSVSDSSNYEEMEKNREFLINKLADLDEQFASHVIECDKIGHVRSDAINKSLRQVTLNRVACPVFIGSSVKNIGVQPLMDAILAYLPSPLDRLHQIGALEPKEQGGSITTGFCKKPFCGFIFKIIHDKNLGPLTFIKVYSGVLRPHTKVINLRDSSKESIRKVYQAFADDFHEVQNDSMNVYNIAVISGMSSAKTGDILVDQSFILSEEQTPITDHSNQHEIFKNLAGILVPNIKRVEPVYYCSIEAPSMVKQKKLEQALECLSREDPSFTYEMEDMGQTIIKGMGKLHIEVIKDRIESEYGVTAYLGPLQITYRETFSGSTEEDIEMHTTLNGVKSIVSMRIRVKNEPKAGFWSPKQLRIRATSENDLGKLRKDFKRALEVGFTAATRYGPVLGFDVIDLGIDLLDFKANGKCSLAIVSSAASQCLTQAIKKCSPVLLEPIMLLEVVVPTEYNGIVLGDLLNRRSLIRSTTARATSILIQCLTPLVELGSYSEHVRVTTSGQGTFSMELYEYARMSETDRAKVIIH